MEQHDQQMEKANEETDRHRMPGWVRAVVAAGIIAAAIIVTAMLVSGADHGPGRHEPDAPAEAPTTHVPPVDHG